MSAEVGNNSLVEDGRFHVMACVYFWDHWSNLIDGWAKSSSGLFTMANEERPPHMITSFRFFYEKVAT